MSFLASKNKGNISIFSSVIEGLVMGAAVDYMAPIFLAAITAAPTRFALIPLSSIIDGRI